MTVVVSQLSEQGEVTRPQSTSIAATRRFLGAIVLGRDPTSAATEELGRPLRRRRGYFRRGVEARVGQLLASLPSHSPAVNLIFA